MGEVKQLELSKDKQYVEVIARLKRWATSIAKEGSRFWIVRPQVGPTTITGLGTIITGPLAPLAKTTTLAAATPNSEIQRFVLQMYNAIGKHAAPTVPARMA